MTRAIVLGGGGPVGMAWECGLLQGLMNNKVSVDAADSIIGTSAGAVVGAALAGGVPLDAVVSAAGAPTPMPEGHSVDLAGMQAAMVDATRHATSAEEAFIAIGKLACSATTVSEADFLNREGFRVVTAQDWPEVFSCAGINIDTGVLTVWNRSHLVPLGRAVAASCAVPTIFPPITVADARFMDGGMGSPLNLHVATGHGALLALSCYALNVPNESPMAAAGRRQLADLDALRAAGTNVVLVEPSTEFSDLSAWGAEVLNVDLVPAAMQAGLRHGADVAAQVLSEWLEAAPVA